VEEIMSTKKWRKPTKAERADWICTYGSESWRSNGDRACDTNKRVVLVTSDGHARCAKHAPKSFRPAKAKPTKTAAPESFRRECWQVLLSAKGACMTTYPGFTSMEAAESFRKTFCTEHAKIYHVQAIATEVKS
jgi:hypothetical protein